MMKWLMTLCVLLGLGYDAALRLLDARQMKKPMPQSVRDIYDAQEYARWQRYDGEKKRLSLMGSVANAVLVTVMTLSGGFAALAKALPKEEYGAAICLMLCWLLISALVSLPFEYAMQMKVEEKYGFNRTTKKTFFLDAVKNMLVNMLLMSGLVAVSIAAWHTLGMWFFLGVYAILALVMLVLSTFSLGLQKLFNKFEPLSEGTLRTRLMELFARNGYQVKNIYVMDASRRTTKANAFCAGLGRFKEIALYDNLVNNFTEDEILAVFAHELTHFKHSDTRVSKLLRLAGFLPIVLVLLAVVQSPACLEPLGFSALNFGMVYIALFEALLSPLMALMGIPMNALSRRMERRADAYPAEIGLGEAMVGALKKLARLNFANLNPHPVTVALTYSHPPIAERIDRIRRAQSA